MDDIAAILRILRRHEFCVLNPLGGIEQRLIGYLFLGRYTRFCNMSLVFPETLVKVLLFSGQSGTGKEGKRRAHFGDGGS